MAPDFQSALPAGEEVPEPIAPGRRPEADEVVPLEGPEPLKPRFRDRWRARRKARRAARGRRLVTFRVVLFVVLLAGILYAAFYAVQWYDTNAYYIQATSNPGELMIYHGRIGGGVLYKPVIVERTGVTTADVPTYTVSQLVTGVQEDSLKAAQAYVANLVATQKQTVCTQRAHDAGAARRSADRRHTTTGAP